MDSGEIQEAIIVENDGVGEEVSNVAVDDCTVFVSDSDCVEDAVAHIAAFDGCDTCDRYKDDQEKRDHHIANFHLKQAVRLKLSDGKKVFTLPCRKGCMPRGGMNATRSHYHCPFCGKTCGRRGSIIYHLKICTGRGQKRPIVKDRKSDGLSRKSMSTLRSPRVPQKQGSYIDAIMEKRLTEWLEEQKFFGTTVDFATLEAKGKFFYNKTCRDLGIEYPRPFYGGNVWIRNFLERNDLKDASIVSLDPIPDDMMNLKATPQTDVIVQVINEVRSRQSLYDPLIEALEGNDSQKEEELWNEIAVIVKLESGEVAKKIWKCLEQKYNERKRNKSHLSENWEYEKYLQFLLSVYEEPNANGTVASGNSIEDVNTRIQDGMLTVSIEGGEVRFDKDHDYRGEGGTLADKVHQAKLRKVNKQIEIMQREHEMRIRNMMKEHNTKMELMQLEKEALRRKLVQ